MGLEFPDLVCDYRRISHCAGCGRAFPTMFATYSFCSTDCAERVAERRAWVMPKKTMRRLKWFFENCRYGRRDDVVEEFFSYLGVNDLEIYSLS